MTATDSRSDADRALQAARELLPTDAQLADRARAMAKRAELMMPVSTTGALLRIALLAAAVVAITVSIVLVVMDRTTPDATDGTDRADGADDANDDGPDSPLVPAPANSANANPGGDTVDDPRPDPSPPAQLDEVVELVALDALADWRFDRGTLIAATDVPDTGVVPVAPHVFTGNVPATVRVPPGAVVIFQQPLAGVSMAVGRGAAVFCLAPASGNFSGDAHCLLVFAAGVTGGVELGEDSRVLTTSVRGSFHLGRGGRLLCRGDVAGPIDVPADGLVAITGSFRSQASVGANGTLVLGNDGRGHLALASGARAFLAGGWRGQIDGPAGATVVLPEPAPWLSGPWERRVQRDDVVTAVVVANRFELP